MGRAAYSAIFGHVAAHPIHFMTNETARMTILHSSGNVGIGTSSPGRQLHLYHASSHAYYRLESGAAANYWDILALTNDLFKIENASGNRFQIADDGVITIAAGTVTSDERLKENINKIGSLNGLNIYEVNYLWSPV